jgi:glutathione S-transferase
MPKPWIFMGVDRSHFSAKLRPAVRYKQMHCVEYPPDVQLIQARTGVRFVPVLFSPDDEVFQDTTDIIDVLETRLPNPPLIPAHPLDHAVCRLFELYADEFFPMVSMRTRWAYPENERELRKAFAAFTGSQAMGEATANLMSSYLPMLGINASTIPAIDAHTTDMLARLDAHLEQHPFLLGDRMSLADCALMGPLYAHLYLDRVTRRQLYESAVHVCMWIERCNRPVPEKMGDWFDGDYPDSLQQVLRLIGDDAVPLLRDHRQAFSNWAATAPRTEAVVPRAAGTYRTSLRNVPVEAGIRPYVSWKVQRLSERGDRAALSASFEQWHCADLLALSAAPRLKKDKFQLVYA